MSKRTRYQARRPMPRIRRRAKQVAAVLTLGELIAAAYDAMGETGAVARVLSSNAMAERIGCAIIVG
ncbi:MAG: hypothetical protein IAE78_26610 [Myxococcus sp.]|nr:hypothetical protein [Myxococcus sp.]